MDWYYVVVVIAAFVAVVGVLIYLGKKGFISSDMLSAFKGLVTGLSDLVDLFTENKTKNPTVDVIDKAMELLEKAVLAAENMWYNGQIDANERHSICVDIFTDLLRVYEIDVPEKFIMIMDKLIAAACESLGHMRVTKAEMEAALLMARAEERVEIVKT